MLFYGQLALGSHLEWGCLQKLFVDVQSVMTFCIFQQHMSSSSWDILRTATRTKTLLAAFQLSVSGDKYNIWSLEDQNQQNHKKEGERTIKERTSWNQTKIYISFALKNTDSEHIYFSRAVYSYRLWSCKDRFQNVSSMFWLLELSEFILALQTYILLVYSCGSSSLPWQAWNDTLDLQDVDKTWTSSHELFISQVLMNHV